MNRVSVTTMVGVIVMLVAACSKSSSAGAVSKDAGPIRDAAVTDEGVVACNSIGGFCHNPDASCPEGTRFMSYGLCGDQPAYACCMRDMVVDSGAAAEVDTELDGGAPTPLGVEYRADLYNPINSGDSAMITRADFETDTCAALDLFVYVSPAVEIRGAYVRQGAAGCCPVAISNGRWLCRAEADCTDWIGMARGDGSAECGSLPGAYCTFNIDFTAEFSADAPWVPESVHFDVMGLPVGSDCEL